ncbi:hypothetical protein [Paenibacillus dendritiformis]|uniref:hypothetical protein n=1 Tax=Paenibacillus dendritiformis TaxID=130049 RepID=UPI00111040EE|nr:hypothetical protein [Paenibacillus dendritiformis]
MVVHKGVMSAYPNTAVLQNFFGQTSLQSKFPATKHTKNMNSSLITKKKTKCMPHQGGDAAVFFTDTQRKEKTPSMGVFVYYAL